jgi:hypothetical protein
MTACSAPKRNGAPPRTTNRPRFGRRTGVALSALLLIGSAFGADLPQKFAGASPLEWSERLAQSEMARRGDTLFLGGSNPRARWDYTTSLFGLSLLKLADRTGRADYADFGAKTVESFVQPDGTIILEQVTLNPARATRSLNSVPAKK